MEQTEAQKQALDKIIAEIKEVCTTSKYTHLCNRIQSENGLAWATNRCIKMMAHDKVELSSALAYLESELEGMD